MLRGYAVVALEKGIAAIYRARIVTIAIRLMF